MKNSIAVLLVLAFVSTLSALTSISTCSDLNVSNEVYDLTADVSCSGSYGCMNINESNVTLQCNGHTISGDGVVWPYNYGINMSGVENITIKDCSVSNFAYGMYITGSSFSNITNSSVSLASIGIELNTDSDNNTLLNNSITAFYGQGILIQASDSNYNLLINNTISTNNAFTPDSQGIRIGSPYNNLTNNDLRNNPLALLVTGYPCENYIDSSNIAGGAGNPIFFAYDSAGITIENSASYGEVLTCSVNNSIIRNISMADGDGIIISNSFNNEVYNNSVSGAAEGIYIYYADNNSVYNNTLSTNGNAGVGLRSANNNTICNNTFTGNNLGMEVYYSAFNRFCNAPISGSSGIYLIGSSNNTIENITADLSSSGISGITFAYGSDDNRIYNFTVTISTIYSSGGGIVDFSSGESLGNTFVDIAIYAIDSTPFGINDWDGMETYINTYIESSSNNFIAPATSQSTFTNLTLANAGSSVNFAGSFAMENSSNISNTNISADFVSIDTDAIPDLNRSANITTYTNTCVAPPLYSLAGFPTSRANILTTGSVCLLCNLISCSGNTIQFDVPEFTGYAAGEMGCVNLSDDSTWGANIVNDSVTGILNVNRNTTLCTDTYYLVASGTYNSTLQMNASNIYLDCNNSVLDGVSGDGFGISNTPFVQNYVIGNCTVANYNWGFAISYSDSNTLIDNVARDTTSVGFRLGYSSNNTLINNTAYNNTNDAFIVTDNSQNNTLIDNVAFNNGQYGIFLAASAYYNNITNMFIYNQSSYITQYSTGGPSNNFTNLTIGYNATVGLINFAFLNTTNLTLYEYPAAPASGTVYLQPDFVYLNDTSALEANVSANITVSTSNCSKGVLRDYDVPLTLADILDTGTHYPTTLSCVGGIARFEVLGFSGYAIGEEITYLSLSIQPDTTVLLSTETNVTCNASNSAVNLTLYRDGVEVNSSFSSVQEITTLAQGPYFYECNATGDGNYTNATASGTLNVVTCTNISSSMTYTLTYDAVGYRSYAGPVDACVYIDASDVTLNCDGYSITGDWTAAGFYYGIYTSALVTNVSVINCSVSNYTDGAYVGSAYGTLMDNEMFNNSRAGIYLVGGGSNVSQNILHNNTQYGAYSDTGGNNRIFNNTIYDGPAAIGLAIAADYDAVYNNTIFGCYYGMYLNSAAYGNITDNEITNNSAYGIDMAEPFLAAAGYNNIIGNIIANNSLFQMLIDDSYANVIYNNLVNASGAQGVVDSNTYEFWNTTKTLGTNIIGGAYKGGNFYSNYTGLDTDGDGIGNTPYIVNQYSSSAPQNSYSFQQTSTGTWTDFANTYDQNWDTYGNAADLAEGYYNFTIPAGASTASGGITIKAGNAGPTPTEALIGTDWGPDCLSTEPLQVKVAGEVNKGAVKADVYCYDYSILDFVSLGFMGTGDAAGVDVYELNATFNVVSSEDSTDYLPLTNNLNYAPTVNITSIGGQANNSEISSLTPAIVFNATDADNSTLNCTVYVDGTIAGGTNESVLSGTLTSMTLNYSLTVGQSYNFTVNCSDDATTVQSGQWVETVASTPNPPATTSSSNPSGEVPLAIIADNEVPQGSEMAIVVERDGHVTLPNAHVVITFGTDTVFTGYTDSWGMVFFTPENTGLYRITATKLGYTAANDSFTVAAGECASNGDCAYDKACTDGRCTQVPEGECGTYSNHAWQDYACCASSDCGEGFQCTEHECVQREVPQQPTGCTIDNECQQGYRCASGTCVQEPVIEPPECVEDGDCQSGFTCSGNVCVEVPTAPGGPVTGPTGGPLQPSTQGGLLGAILNLWWLWLILIALVAYYIYRKGKEKK